MELRGGEVLIRMTAATRRLAFFGADAMTIAPQHSTRRSTQRSAFTNSDYRYCSQGTKEWLMAKC
jgi:hypothetical protein